MGDGNHYTLSSRDNATSIPANVSSLFAQASLLPPGLALSSSGLISGVATQAGSFTFSLHLADSGSPNQTADSSFRLNVLAIPRLSLSWAEGAGCWLNFSSLTGQLYRVERSEDMCSPNGWQVLTDNVPGTGGPISVRDADACTRRCQFYRLSVR